MAKPAPDNQGLIQMHLRRRAQLFDSLDHSPFREKDLDHNAEEYIVESVKELPSDAPLTLLIHLEEAPLPAKEHEVIRTAVHVHFQRRAEGSRRALRELLRRGTISLVIGLAFLVTSFLIGQLVHSWIGNSQWEPLIRESLLIGGWVAMWKPLEVFLYDWWPLMGERKIFDRLSVIDLRIVETKE